MSASSTFQFTVIRESTPLPSHCQAAVAWTRGGLQVLNHQFVVREDMSGVNEQRIGDVIAQTNGGRPWTGSMISCRDHLGPKSPHTS